MKRESITVSQNMERKHPGSPGIKKFTTILNGKGDANHILGLEDYLERVYDQQCKIQCFACQQPEASNSSQTPKYIVEENFVDA